MTRQKKMYVAGAFLLASLLIMLLFCGSSPLYPTNPWGDANCFHTMARGMVDGKLLYRDLLEQKGPLLFLVHVIAVLISPDSFFGVFLFEVLALAGLMYFSWKTISLFVKESCWPLIIFAGFLVVTTRAFVWGDSAEELCWPLLAWSLYDAMHYFYLPEQKMTNGCLLRNGVLAGIVMWIKYSLLGLHFAWMAVVAIECVARRRKLGRAVGMCLVFLAGMALPSVACVGYFAAHDALPYLLEGYLTLNTGGYIQNVNPLLNCLIGLFGGSLVNCFPGCMLGVGMIWMILVRRKDGNAWGKICLVAMVFCAAFLVYCGGRTNGYYYLVLTVFAPFGCIPLMYLWERAKKAGWKSGASVAMATVICLSGAVSVVRNRNLPYLGMDREELVQVRFARIINETEDASLLNCGFLDGGFYLASGCEPINRWYHTMLTDRERCYADQSALVEQGLVDYVVTMKVTLEECGIDDSDYELVAHDVEQMNYNARGNTYYLYRRCA